MPMNPQPVVKNRKTGKTEFGKTMRLRSNNRKDMMKQPKASDAKRGYTVPKEKK